MMICLVAEIGMAMFIRAYGRGGSVGRIILNVYLVLNALYSWLYGKPGLICYGKVQLKMD